MTNIRAVLEQAGSTLKAAGEWVVRGYSEGDRRAQQLFPRVRAEQPQAAQQPASLAGRVSDCLNQMGGHVRNIASRVASVVFGASNVALRLVQLAFVAAGMMTVAPIALRMAVAGLLISLLGQASAALQQSPARSLISDWLNTLQRILGTIQGLFQPAPAAPAAPSVADID
jgi:hypothetical protein